MYDSGLKMGMDGGVKDRDGLDLVVLRLVMPRRKGHPLVYLCFFSS